jgi:tetratricopeptide (TPR) repeat protein
MKKSLILIIVILINVVFVRGSLGQTEVIEVAPSSEPTTIEIRSREVDLAAAAAALSDYRRAAEGYRKEVEKLKRTQPEFQAAAEGLVRNLQGVGLAHYLLGQSRESIAAYDEAVKASNDFLGKSDGELLCKRAQAYGQAGEHQRVIEELEPLRAGKNPIVLYTLALSYSELKKDDEAASLFEEVLKERPDDYNTAHHLAYIYGRLKKYNEAADAYLKAIRLAGDSDKKTLEDLYLSLGLSYKNACRKPEAREAFLKAAEINEKHYEQLAHLAFYRCSSARGR